MNETILIVEDEETLRNSLIRVLSREGYTVGGVDNGEEALRRLGTEAIDLVVTDIILPGISGIELLRSIKESTAQTAVIIMTAFASLETAVETLRSGAHDYLVKPIIHEELKQIVRSALDSREIKQKSRRLQRRLSNSYDLGRIIGRHPEILQIIARVNKIEDDCRHILITGEIGTGKRLLARAIHFNGSRADRPLFSLDLRLVPPQLWESRLFGGSEPASPVTGEGLVNEVEGGRIYLSHVERLSKPLQQRLVELIKAETASGGALGPAAHHFLLIAGSHLPPEILASEDHLLPAFADLLTAATFRIPPLRERKEDLEPLARFFIEHYSAEFDKSVTALAPETLAAFAGYPWPGNVRELRAILERAVLLCDGPMITLRHLPALGSP